VAHNFEDSTDQNWSRAHWSAEVEGEEGPIGDDEKDTTSDAGVVNPGGVDAMSSHGGKKANLAKFHERAIAISQVLFLPAGPARHKSSAALPSALCTLILSGWLRMRATMLLHPTRATRGANRTRTRMVRGQQ
jgi:hypothetical protein